MTSFEKELLGSHGFSLIPPNRLSAVISANPRLLLPSKSMLAYARKQSRFTIFKWIKEDRGWFWHAGDYPTGLEKKAKVTNISMPSKKSYAKSKSAKKGDDFSEAFLDIIPFESDLPPIGNIVLESSLPPSTRTHSSRHPTTSKYKPTAPQPSTDASPSSRTRGSKRKTSPPSTSTTTEKRVCYI